MNRAPIPGVFGFESFMEHTLEYMPMSVRMKLDLCGLKFALIQWCGLPLAVRQTVLDASCETPHDIVRMRSYLEFTVAAHGLGQLASIYCNPQAWSARSRLPAALMSAIDALGLPRPGRPAWAGLSDLQRFALVKLTRDGGSRNLRPALEEFGLCEPRPEPAWQPADSPEAQVFASLAKALRARPRAEFVRAMDAGDGAGMASEY